MKRVLYLAALILVALGAFVSWRMTRIETRLSSGFSLGAFEALPFGVSPAFVEEKLGKPLEEATFSTAETWLYSLASSSIQADGLLNLVVHLETFNPESPEITFDQSGRVDEILGLTFLTGADLRKGDPESRVKEVLGDPCVKIPAGVYQTWYYSKPAKLGANWEMVAVTFSSAHRLVDKTRRTLWD